MATPAEVLAKAARSKNVAESTQLLTNAKQIVYGEVYAPDVVDTHGDAMTASDIEEIAHRFLIEAKNHQIDLMHDNAVVKASVVESFIARDDDTVFTPGSWVLGVKIFDESLWKQVVSGVFNGYSMEIATYRETVKVNVNVQPDVFGITAENNGHNHAYYVKMSDDGRVVGGRTSEDAGHSHIIRYGTATEMNDNHAHRFVLP